jgi:hypothetical protein
MRSARVRAMIGTAELISLHRSAAMQHRGQKVPVDRDELCELCEELIQLRGLLQRFGADLRNIAAHAPRPTTPPHPG